MIKKIILFISFVISLKIFLSPPNYIDKRTILFLLAISLLCIIVALNKKESEPNLKGQYFRHSILVLFSYVIVHFQLHVDLILGFVDESYPLWYNSAIVVKSMALSVIGLISFAIGYLLHHKARKPAIPKRYLRRICDTKFITFFSVILLAFYFYYANPLYLMGYYGTEDLGSEAKYIILLFQVLICAALIQNSRNFVIRKKKFSNFIDYFMANGFLVNLLLLVYLTSVLVSGDRGPIIWFAIVYYSSYLFVTKNKTKFLKAMGVLLVGSSLISFLGMVRNIDPSLPLRDRFVQAQKIENRFGVESIIPLTQELAGSIKTIHYTLDYIPHKHDYLYGRFQIQQILSIIPFSQFITNFIFKDHHYKYGSSAQFNTWIRFGDNPSSGEGTTVISDFYYDFGIIGVITGMFLLGFLMRFSEISMYSNNFPNLFTHSFFIVCLSESISLARSTFLIELKIVFWVFWVLVLNELIFSKFWSAKPEKSMSGKTFFEKKMERPALVGYR